MFFIDNLLYFFVGLDLKLSSFENWSRIVNIWF